MLFANNSPKVELYTFGHGSFTGTRLGRYEIRSKIGEGGMGEAAYEVSPKIGEDGKGVVYRARDEKSNRYVAVKVLPPPLLVTAIPDQSIG